jgi:hypothetical protein
VPNNGGVILIKAASLFESYNMAVEKGYNCIFDNNENKIY